MRPLKVKAVIAKHLSVVGHENHDRVVTFTCVLECSHHSADLFVDEFDHCVVGSRDLLLIPVGHLGHVVPIRVVVGKTAIKLLIGGLGVEFARLGLGKRHVVRVVPRQKIGWWVKRVVRGETIVTKEPGRPVLLANELDRFFRAPGRLIELFWNAVLDVIG